jgi:hypothetical protein
MQTDCLLDQLQDGKMKDGTISKLAGKCGELFNQAYEQAAPDGSKQVFPSVRTRIAMCVRVRFMNYPIIKGMAGLFASQSVAL